MDNGTAANASMGRGVGLSILRHAMVGMTEVTISVPPPNM